MLSRQADETGSLSSQAEGFYDPVSDFPAENEALQREPEQTAEHIEATLNERQDVQRLTQEDLADLQEFESRQLELLPEAGSKDIIPPNSSIHSAAELDAALQDCQHLTTKISALEESRRDLAAQVEQMTMENSTLQALHGRGPAKDDVPLVESPASGRQQEAIEYETVVGRLSASEDLAGLEIQHGQLQGEHACLQAQFKELLKRCGDATEQLSQIGSGSPSLGKNYIELEGQLEDLQDSYGKLETQSALLLEDNKARQQAHAGQVRSLEQSVIEARQHVINLEVHIGQSQDTETQSADHIQEICAFPKDSRWPHEASSSQISNLDTEKGELQADCISVHRGLQDEFADAQNAIKELQNDNAELREKGWQAESQLQKLQQRNTVLEEACASLQALQLQLHGEQVRVAEQLEMRDKQREEVQIALHSAQQDLQDLISKHDALRHSHAREVSCCVTLRSERDELAEACKQNTEATGVMGQQQAELQDRLAAALKDSQGLTADHDGLRHDHAKNVEALTRLQAQHDELQRVQRDTQKQLEDLEEQRLSFQQERIATQVYIAAALKIVAARLLVIHCLAIQKCTLLDNDYAAAAAWRAGQGC